VIPERDGKPLFRPSRASTLGVAALLGLAATAVAGCGGWWVLPATLATPMRAIVAAVSVAFAARAVGDFRYLGFFKRVRGTRFARADDRYFVPLCLALSAATAWVAAG
jgi:hypothetical protein